MDRNQAVGFILMAALLMVYFYFFQPKPLEQTPGSPTDSTNNITNQAPQSTQQQFSAENQTAVVEEPAIDSADLENEKFGVFTKGLIGEEEHVSLENEVINLKFSTKGGLINVVELKEYDDYQYQNPLVILDEKSSKVRYLVSTQYGPIDLAELYFTYSKRNVGDSTELTFTSDLGDNKSIQHIYKISKDQYGISHKFLVNGLENEIAGQKVSFIWDNYLKRLETDIEYSRNYTTMNYWLSSGSKEELPQRSSDREEQTFAEPVSWFSFKQKFFTSGYVFNRPVVTGTVSSQFNEMDTSTVKYCKAMVELPLASLTENAGENKMFFGPNRLKDLNKVTTGFDENLYLGWPVIKWINKYVIISIFTFLEKYITSYGLIIIILVFIIKLVLSPLTYKSHISMAKTKALKPELDELKEKYGDDMQKMQSEQMKLYQQVGVNPLSGCIPMLAQMPVLFAMFQFIPHAIELRHRSFLWAPDLSTYDAIISWSFDIPLISSFYGNHVSLFTLLMTISTILYTWINSQSTAQLQGPMKTMQYFMPIMFMFILNKFPAGLTFYYFVSNIVSFGQIAIIRRFVDDTKIRAILEENKKKNKNKKKSKFQARLEDAMKAQEEAKKKKGKR